MENLEIEEEKEEKGSCPPFSIPFNVYLNKTIGSDTNHVIKEMLYWENENIKASSEKNPVYPIVLHINSYGGSVYDSMAIVDTMRGIETPVVTYSYGKAMSAAAIILMAGTPGNRLISPNSWIMIHELSTWIGGSFSEVDNTLRHIKKVQNQLVSHISKCCKRDKSEIAKFIKEDQYFTAREAVKFGIADAVSVVPKIIKQIPLKYRSKKGKKGPVKKLKKHKSKGRKGL